MKKTPFSLVFDDDNVDSLALKDTLLKYLRYWPWFLGVTLVTMALAYVYTIYVPNTYQTVAKIKIVDDTKELNVATDAFALMGGSSVNLENEI